MSDPPSIVDLYWIPLGAGANVVRLSGRLFEAVSAFASRRPRCAVYHSALEVSVSGRRFVVEQTPVIDRDGAARGVVAEGPVGIRLAGRFRIFRYEIRRWLDGEIPDVRFAVGGPVHLTDDGDTAQRILDVLPTIATPVWGRDELRTGEMWNSNSVVSWVLARAGVDVAHVQPPPGGRAPGWHAGCVVAAREIE